MQEIILVILCIPVVKTVLYCDDHLKKEQKFAFPVYGKISLTAENYLCLH